MIRYDIGDIGTLAKNSTYKHPVLLNLTGRTNDVARLADGKGCPGLTFYYVTKSIIEDAGSIKEFLIVQTELVKFKIEYVNYVKDIYSSFTQQEVSGKIAEMLTDSDVKAEVKIVYQSIDNLHKAVPNDLGDWYFTGDYPTPGGNKVVSTSFLNDIHGIKTRAY